VKTASVLRVSIFILKNYHSHKSTRAHTPHYQTQDETLYQSQFLPLVHSQEIWGFFLETERVKYTIHTLQITATYFDYLNAVIYRVYTEVHKSKLQNLWTRSVDASQAYIHRLQNLKGKL